MRGAGYDPYDRYILAQEIRQAKWESTRPTCEACGDRILTEHLYRIGSDPVCEECVNDAWDVVQKNMHRLFMEEYGAHSDYFIIEAIIEHILETFEIGDFKNDTREDND